MPENLFLTRHCFFLCSTLILCPPPPLHSHMISFPNLRLKAKEKKEEKKKLTHTLWLYAIWFDSHSQLSFDSYLQTDMTWQEHRWIRFSRLCWGSLLFFSHSSKHSQTPDPRHKPKDSVHSSSTPSVCYFHPPLLHLLRQTAALHATPPQIPWQKTRTSCRWSHVR